MSGTTITQSTQSTQSAAAPGRPAGRPRPPGAASADAGAGPASLTPSRAARELGLKRGEFELAVHLGRVRTVPDDRGGGARRVTRPEIERVRAASGSTEALRERVRTVGTKEAAALMEVTTARFTRLARLGLLVPVTFYLNRYRAVVWLYLAEELRQFAAGEENARLLSGRIPEGLRDQLDQGLDLRPRNWRGRHRGFLLRRTEDPWAQAAIVSAQLDPLQVAEVVPDPYERAHLNRFRPEQAGRTAPDSPAAEVAARIMTAQDADEIGWLRADLAQAVADARETRPAPRPFPNPPPSPVTPRPGGSENPALTLPSPTTARPCSEGPGSGEPPEPTRRRFGWLRRRST